MLSVIVPYRDRHRHLTRFVPDVSKWIKKQCLEFEILVIEQGNDHPFNRGALMNIGYLLSDPASSHIITHDIDMIPQKSGCHTCGTETSSGVDYSFSEGITHLAGRASQFGYKMPYKTYIGGVTMFDHESFKAVNGYSNKYWGWGAEDDDLYNRITTAGIKIKWKDYRFLSLFHKRLMDHKLYSNNSHLLKSGTNDGVDSIDFEIISERKYQNARIVSVNFSYI